MADQTVADLGKLVKSKYPGSYDNIPDADLGVKVKAKYPGSYDQFQAAPATPAAPEAFKQPEGSAAGRLFGGLWDTTVGGLGNTAKILMDAMRAGTTGNPVSPDTAAALGGIVQAHVDQAHKAKAAIDRGDHVEAAGHILASALPLVGPAAAHAGERIGGEGPQFDKYGNVTRPGQAPDIAGGVGEGAGLIVPMVAGPAIGKVAGKVDAAADATAQSLTKSSLKGGYTVNAPAEDVAAAATAMREQGASLSAAGTEKISRALESVRTAIGEKVQGATRAGVTVNPDKVLGRLDELYGKYRKQVNPNQDLADINRVGNNFAENNQQPIPADQAQAMKVGSNALNSDKYGKVSTAQVEAEKSLTRGLKEELEAQIPELGSLNAAQAKLLNLDDILGRAVNKYVNSQGFTADLKTTNISAAALRSVLANPALKARLAVMIDTARRASPGKLAASQVGTERVANLVGNLAQGDQQ